MFYGIYGDSDGDSPQVIGEASWLMARTCFPNDNLNGGVGHDAADVTCKSGTYMSLFRHLLIQKRHPLHWRRCGAPQQCSQQELCHQLHHTALYG